MEIDYLKERREDVRPHREPFSSQKPSATATASTIFVLLAFGCSAYFAWDYWGNTRATVTTTALAPASSRKPAARLPDTQEKPFALPGRPNTTMVIKCVINGATTYAAREADCPEQGLATVVAIDPRQNLSDGLPNSAEIIRRPSPYAPPEVLHAAGPDPKLQRTALCRAYEEEIKTIDARAREPLPPQEQDRLTAQRRKARDEQFRLQC
jgi:hypothetical protein